MQICKFFSTVTVINVFVNTWMLLGKTNKEFNMRHDWNSLLSDDESLLMTRYSKKFFPDADDLVRLLQKIILLCCLTCYVENQQQSNF